MKKLVGMLSLLFLLTTGNVYSMANSPINLYTFIAECNAFISKIEPLTYPITYSLGRNLACNLNQIKNDYEQLCSMNAYRNVDGLLIPLTRANINVIINTGLSNNSHNIKIENLSEEALIKYLIEDIEDLVIENPLEEQSIEDREEEPDVNSISGNNSVEKCWKFMFINEELERIGKEFFYGTVMGTGHAMLRMLEYKNGISKAPKTILFSICCCLILGSIKSSLDSLKNVSLYYDPTTNTIKNVFGAGLRMTLLYASYKLFWQSAIHSVAQAA